MDSNRIKKRLGTAGKIALFRYRKQMTLIDLGAEVNLSRQTLSHYEQGKSVPDLIMAYEIATALNVDIKDLLPGEIEITTDESRYLDTHGKHDKHLLSIQKLFEDLRTH